MQLGQPPQQLGERFAPKELLPHSAEKRPTRRGGSSISVGVGDGGGGVGGGPAGGGSGCAGKGEVALLVGRALFGGRVRERKSRSSCARNGAGCLQ